MEKMKKKHSYPENKFINVKKCYVVEKEKVLFFSI